MLICTHSVSVCLFVYFVYELHNNNRQVCCVLIVRRFDSPSTKASVNLFNWKHSETANLRLASPSLGERFTEYSTEEGKYVLRLAYWPTAGA